MADIMTDFYQNLLGKQEQYRSPINMDVIGLGHTLTQEQQLRLCQPFNKSEIKQAIFSIPSHKSPGPDGFNSGFYKANWDVIGSLVCSNIQEFSRLENFLGYMGRQR